MKTGGRAAGCAAVFFLPFAGFGVAALVIAATRLPQREWGTLLPFAILGLVFTLVGVGGIWAALRAARLARDADRLRALHPEEPWHWRPDWSSGVLVDASRGRAFGAWGVAVLWNLVALPAGFLGVRAALADGQLLALVALLFPAVGVWLLVRALVETGRHRRYGASELTLETIPGVIGHDVRGAVACAMDPRGGDTVTLTLTCLRRVTTGSGKNRSTREEILWQDRREVRPEPARGGARLPFAFPVPSGHPPSDPEPSNDYVIWRLEAAADVPGVDYAARFELPVFRTAASAIPAVSTPNDDDFTPPADSAVHVTRSRRGLEIVFPAARHKGAAVAVTLFALVFGGAAVVLLRSDAPLFMAAAFALFTLLLGWAALHLWAGRSRVQAGYGTLELETGTALRTRHRTFRATEIAAIRVARGMQAGNRAYWDLKLELAGGRAVTLGSAVPDVREAEWLARQLRHELGLQPAADPADPAP